ncbi:MAG: hypothetical protein PWQ72_1164 [Pseudothermotoga sp.]|jgi:hypothetical protein|uniref:hypothetical protein n=1 Tax=Pseudothermotoga TaxID=1643951 RepID=UPI000749AA2D|nr:MULTISPECIES: hypothetical protein [Pseudothermotoga]KUK21274.1 MAG: Uncharacterized protein XD56_0819 [Pseudothermotoga lettingae]MDI3495037.1 hypothetical protein [Pseudothermotoga sp.]MDK2885207.1 hypothetical protein [Pseudothermotoga sp.]HBJ80382.1 hypothetical protein [Pseudothermotoga sp.]HBT26446.1 hypothetical protein [Pseudothermotoga sp.]
MRIGPVDSTGVSYESAYVPQKHSQTQTQILDKDQMIQLLNFMFYQKNGLDVKLVRIAGELFSKSQMNVTV